MNLFQHISSNVSKLFSNYPHFCRSVTRKWTSGRSCRAPRSTSATLLSAACGRWPTSGRWPPCQYSITTIRTTTSVSGGLVRLVNLGSERSSDFYGIKMSVFSIGAIFWNVHLLQRVLPKLRILQNNCILLPKDSETTEFLLIGQKHQLNLDSKRRVTERNPTYIYISIITLIIPLENW